MGCSIFGKTSGCYLDSSWNKPPPSGNPNPKNFQIIRSYENGNFLIAELRYPDCANYEGRKILVFEGLDYEDFLDLKAIDPHFCNGPHPAPVARFSPTKEGWQRAIRFVDAEA